MRGFEAVLLDIDTFFVEEEGLDVVATAEEETTHVVERCSSILLYQRLRVVIQCLYMHTHTLVDSTYVVV